MSFDIAAARADEFDVMKMPPRKGVPGQLEGTMRHDAATFDKVESLIRAAQTGEVGERLINKLC
ncbi:hypothetical protein B1812_12290 [Methylocystis bryophila]|uniref:Uncharacterized protein n=1 Tax=Methylocystis bryophila TaxID=655015 RepID=A0A1W6MVX7_9HYPH|nr:hypothetical protein B1812_12290 [Methylocystis bryophila]